MADILLTQAIDIESGSALPMDEYIEDEGMYSYYQQCKLRGLAKLTVFRNNEPAEFRDVFVVIHWKWDVIRRNNHGYPNLADEFAAGQMQKVVQFHHILNDWYLKMLDHPGKYALSAQNLTIEWPAILTAEPDAIIQDGWIKDAQSDIGKALLLNFGHRRVQDDNVRFGLNMDMSLNELDQNPSIQRIRDILNKRI